MSFGPTAAVLDGLRCAVLLREHAALSDAELLDRYVRRREPLAFETLVRRHGPMVLGVCRRILGHAHDAEDAFQAVFLVLTRKAASLSRPDLLGPWLHGVAFRIARRSKAMTARRLAHERAAAERLHPEGPCEDAPFDDLEPFLDAAIARLPRKYRLPLVLCELEGKSRKEAAQRLKIPEGTLSSRLARAREMLRKRLLRRGVTLSGAALTTVLAQHATAAVPPTLVAVTVQGALIFGSVSGAAAGVLSAQAMSLAEGTLRRLLLAKLQVVLLVGLGLSLLLGGLALNRCAGPRPEASEEMPAFALESHEATCAAAPDDDLPEWIEPEQPIPDAEPPTVTPRTKPKIAPKPCRHNATAVARAKLLTKPGALVRKTKKNAHTPKKQG
jgi:RNA polymerase sigma factor (sigma-70 family)